MRARALRLFACALLASRGAVAEATVEWTAPRECPAAAEVKSEISQLVGKNLADVASDVSATVHITRVSASSLEARVWIRGGGATRERVMHDASCPALSRAATLVVALSIDPSEDKTAPGNVPPRAASATAPDGTNAVATLPPSPPEEGASPAPVVATPQTRTAPVVAPAPEPLVRDHPPGAETGKKARTPRALHAYAGGGVALLGGVLPGAAPALALSGGLLTPEWRVGAHLSFAPAQSATLETPTGVGGQVGLASAAVDAGYRVRLSALEIPLLAGFEAGVFDASGEGVTVSQQTRPLWLAAYAGTGVLFWWNDRVAIGLQAQAIAALQRPRFAVESTDGEQFVFHQPSALGGRAFLELEVRLE